MLAAFTSLRSLTLGQTLSRRPSLAFVRGLPQLGVLWLEAHARDFDAVGEVETLTRLHLRVPRARSLEPLRGHPSLEVLTMDFGGIRDLSCLKDIPRLRGLGLYQVRKLDTGDLDAVGDCAELEAVSLGALRNVESLRAFAQGPRSTLRLLTLERLPALATLADLANCKRLEQLGLYDSRPADGRLDHLLGCPALKHLVASDRYPRASWPSCGTGSAARPSSSAASPHGATSATLPSVGAHPFIASWTPTAARRAQTHIAPRAQRGPEGRGGGWLSRRRGGATGPSSRSSRCAP